MGYCTAVTNPCAKQRVDICKVIRKLNRPGNVHIQLLHEKIMLLQKWFDQIVKLEYPVAKRVNASTIVTRSQNFRQLPLVCASPRHHTVSVFKNWNRLFPHITLFPLRRFFIYGSESDRKHRSLESLLQSHLHKFSEVQSFKGTSIMQ